jgi:hypothetical protein
VVRPLRPGQSWNRGSVTGRDKLFYFSPQRPDRLWGPLSHLFKGYRDSFPGVKWLGREADDSLFILSNQEKNFDLGSGHAQQVFVTNNRCIPGNIRCTEV